MEELKFYKPSAAAQITALALTPAAPSSSDDILLRIANTSDLYQAENVVVSCDGSQDGRDLWLSLDGADFSASIEVGDILPGGLSLAFTLRRVSPSDTGVGLKQCTLKATPAGWTNPIDTSSSDDIPLDLDEE